MEVGEGEVDSFDDEREEDEGEEAAYGNQISEEELERYRNLIEIAIHEE